MRLWGRGDNVEDKKELPIRKAVRLKNFNYSSCGAYFVTICTKDRRKILSQIVGGDVLCQEQHSAVAQFISTFKRFCNKEYGENIWQRHYNDHIIRDREDYEEHVKYICENPMNCYYDELYE